MRTPKQPEEHHHNGGDNNDLDAEREQSDDDVHDRGEKDEYDHDPHTGEHDPGGREAATVIRGLQQRTHLLGLTTTNPRAKWCEWLGGGAGHREDSHRRRMPIGPIDGVVISLPHRPIA